LGPLRAAPAKVHPTAIVEDGVVLGDGTVVWDGVHLRRGARIGRGCIVGEKTYVAYGVLVGDRCKLNAHVYLCAGVALEDGVLVAAHVVFTNDRAPRAAERDLARLLTSEPTDSTLRTLVRRGASLGANATIGPGLTLGEYCMVGMGAVVTKDVPPFGLVVGNPARLVGLVARDGTRVLALGEDAAWPPDGRYPCPGDGALVVRGSAIVHEAG
jgi:acetyltransferase-like isoleucine patch superfamily enzyme